MQTQAGSHTYRRGGQPGHSSTLILRHVRDGRSAGTAYGRSREQRVAACAAPRLCLCQPVPADRCKSPAHPAGHGPASDEPWDTEQSRHRREYSNAGSADTVGAHRLAGNSLELSTNSGCRRSLQSPSPPLSPKIERLAVDQPQKAKRAERRACRGRHSSQRAGR